jgi:deferrochelatase/peroxidase EfeB
MTGPGASGQASGAAPSRRQLLAGAGVFGAGAVAGGLAGYAARPGGAGPASESDATGGSDQAVPFYGPHQAGIATPAQDRLAFGSLNAVPGATRADVRDLLREWTTAAARMASGKLIGEVTAPYAPPVDTGEAAGSPVARLTIALGFGRTSTTTTAQATPRNLLGFKDGTRNIKAEQARLMDDHVWVGRETDQAWLRGGSYLIARKVRIFVENWDRDHLQDQENVIGRAKASGAPLTGGTEFTRPDFAARDAGGKPVIPRTRTSGWPASSTTAGPGSCGAATPSPTASTRAPEPCWAGCSSSRS